MKKLILILAFCALASFSYADYAVESKGGAVLILNGELSEKDILEYLKSQDLEGQRIVKITEKDLPPIEDRKYWAINPEKEGPRIIVDQNLKNADLNIESQKVTRKTNALKKFCSSCTDQDLKDLLS